MDREHLRLKREQFKRDMHRVSEEKSRKLFEKDEDRNKWVEVIRKSVEKEIEARVREALGTPPKERQRKRLEELTAKRFAKIEEEKRVMASNIMKQASFERRTEEDDELLWLRRQKYLEKFNRRRTMREVPSPVLRSITAKRHASVSPKSDQNPPIVWESCETVPEKILSYPTQFKRAVSASSSPETTVEKTARNGPYFPSGRMPCMAAPKHLNCIPNFVEDLNTPGMSVAFLRRTHLVYKRLNVLSRRKVYSLLRLVCKRCMFKPNVNKIFLSCLNYIVLVFNRGLIQIAARKLHFNLWKCIALIQLFRIWEIEKFSYNLTFLNGKGKGS